MHSSGQIPNLTLLCPPPPSTGSQEVTQTGILGIPEDGARGWGRAQFSGDEQEASLHISNQPICEAWWLHGQDHLPSSKSSPPSFKAQDRASFHRNFSWFLLSSPLIFSCFFFFFPVSHSTGGISLPIWAWIINCSKLHIAISKLCGEIKANPTCFSRPHHTQHIAWV